MAVNSSQFEEKQWRKPLRHFKESLYVFFGKALRVIGLLQTYPRNPIFIVGSPRSGTSIFNKMISECDEVANFSEAIFVWSPGDIDPNCDHIKLVTDATEEDENRIKGGFGIYQFLKRKSVFVNKCPRSSVRIPFIDKLFPEAKYIHIYRDGRAVVSSIIDIVEREEFRKEIPLGGFCKPANWRDLMTMSELERHSHQWLEIMNEIRDNSKIVGRTQWLDVCYEEFCEDPVGVMNKVFQFIGLHPSEELLHKIEALPQKNEQKWRKKFSDEEVHLMNSIMGQQLKDYQYEL